MPLHRRRHHSRTATAAAAATASAVVAEPSCAPVLTNCGGSIEAADARRHVGAVARGVGGGVGGG